MANPRALAIARLREKEELARQAAILGAEKQRGIMSSLPTNLGSIGQFISDDSNDLDNLSFSTDKGLKVNLQNNRNKESGDPKVKLADMDFSNLSSIGANVHPRITAMDQHRDTSALDSFIATNSAAPKISPRDQAREDLLLKIQIEKNKELAKFKGDSSRIPPAGFAPDAGLQLDPETQAYKNIPELDESVREQAIRNGMTTEELDELLLEMEIEENKKLAEFRGDSSRIPPAGSVMQ